VTGHGEVKVLDFGLAKLTRPPLAVDPFGYEAGLGSPQATATGQPLGTRPCLPSRLAAKILTRSTPFSLGAVTAKWQRAETRSSAERRPSSLMPS
jgi:hypothetical protein